MIPTAGEMRAKRLWLMLRDKLRNLEEVEETKTEEKIEEKLQKLRFSRSIRGKLEQFNYEVPVEDYQDGEIPVFSVRNIEIRRNETIEACPGLVKDCLKGYIRRKVLADLDF